MTATAAADRRALWGAVVAVASTATAGAAMVAVRFAVAEVPPLALTLMRMATTLAVIAPLALLLGGKWPRGRDLAFVVTLGIVLFAFGQWLVSVSLSFTTAARGAIIFSTMPVMTLVAAAALGIERLTAAKAGGVVLAMAGIALAMGGGAAGVPGGWRGDAIMVVSTVIIAGYNIVARDAARRYPPFVFITANMAPAVVVLGLITAATGTPLLTLDLAPEVWAAVAFIGLVGGAAAYGLFLLAISMTTPTRVAIAVPVNPLVAILLGAAVLGEHVGVGTIVGFLCVAAGVVLVNLPARA
ncbi:MAG: DMT family transporter [Alphaproteobacteria bacterium]